LTDKELAIGSSELICGNNKKGLKLSVKWDIENGCVSYNGLFVSGLEIGYIEKYEVRFLFQDDTEYAMISREDVTFRSYSSFDLDHQFFDKINQKKVKEICFKNGRSGKTYTYALTPSQQTYFIGAKRAMVSWNLQT